MTLLELHADNRELIIELHDCRIALESIAQSLLRLTEIPAAPSGPEKPLGPEAVSSYANALLEMEGEESDVLRARLRAMGFTDEQIEREIVAMFTAGNSGEESTE